VTPPLAPFVDTHVHFYDLGHPTLRWIWLEPGWVHPLLGDIDAIKAQRFAAEELLAESRFAGVSKVVHVQAALGSPDPVDETRWLSEMAERTGVPHGIVAECHLAAPDAEAVLEQHAAFARVRGIRDFGEGDYLRDPAWQRGYRALARHGFVCCLDSSPETYAAAAELARAVPDVVLCIDHAGFPRARDAAYFEHWRRELAPVAALDNTVVKISGLGMFDHRWTVASIRPWVLACLELFGVHRSFFGTNWPVDRLYSSYPDVVAAYREIVAAELGADEQAAVLAGNAERIFRL
jgi:predicted TIM-barrel fold metal-dependent hydrolase